MDILYENITMAELQLAPSDIYYSQSSISNCFKKASLYAGKSIGDTVDDIMLKRCRLEDIPNISVVKKGDVWVSEDNRRLWVFKALESLGQCDKISVIVKTSINHKKDVIQKDITVRGDPGGIFYKYKVNLHKLKEINIKSNGLLYNFFDLYFHVQFFFSDKISNAFTNCSLSIGDVRCGYKLNLHQLRRSIEVLKTIGKCINYNHSRVEF